MASLALAFDVIARDKGASRTFDKIGDSAERAGHKGKGFGSAIKGAMGIASGALAAAGVGELVGSITKGIGDSIAEAREAQKVGRTTAAVIKATGGASKITAAQVGDLATAISNKSGVDDEAIQSGANLLLTFKQVRNEAGKGNDVFNRATQAATDLSAAGFGSITGASVMLGKALNDPLKGISALGRAGVTFTASQKEQIKTLVASGQTLQAQKVILGEVEHQVGGVAAANASMGDKVKVAVGNIKESIGSALLPILDRLGQWFLTKGLPAVQRFGGWISGQLWPALQRGAAVILPAVHQALATVTGGVGKGTVSWQKIGNVISGTVIPVMAKIISVWLPAVARNVRIVIEAVKFLSREFEFWRGVVNGVISFVLGRFATLSHTWAVLLRALSHVPGFGWARDAANKMDGAAGKASSLARAIQNIPSHKSVSIDVAAHVMTGRIMVAGKPVNVGMRAAGGPVKAGQPYIVGEHRPELFVPSISGRIFPRVPMSTGQAAQAVQAAPQWPTTLVLRVGEREFTAYVDERASEQISSAATAARWSR